MTDGQTSFRESPRSYCQLLQERIDLSRLAAWLLVVSIIINISVNGVMVYHTYISQISIYSAGQFDHLTWWMFAVDTAIYMYLLYRISSFMDGRADTETLFGEFVSHPLWLYLFLTSASMVVPY